MAKGRISIRLEEDLVRDLELLGKQSGQSLSQVVRRLVDEGVRMERHPGIVFRSGPAGRRAGLAQGPDIWEVASVLRALKGSTKDVLGKASELTGQPVHLLRIALTYYVEFRSEIDDWIEDNDEYSERSEAL
jgi:hypothetical protein